MRIISVLAALLLGGCAACQQHPAVCGAVALVAAGAIIAADHRRADLSVEPKQRRPGLLCQPLGPVPCNP